MTSAETPGGGFIQNPLLSPAPSTSTATPSSLPKPRAHPLRAGSLKETTVINHVDKVLLSVNRRHAKKFSSAFDDQNQQASERGYESFKEVAKDLDGVVDVLWVSGTPSIQIPYLITVAGLINTYLPDFPFSPGSTFRLLRKLDSVFASLLLGEDADTGAPLSGFEGRSNVVSMTEKVRIKSLAETCRVAVVEASEQVDEEMDAESADAFDEQDDDDDDNDDDFGTGTGEYQAPGRWDMEAAKVYEKTIQLLGDELGKAGEFVDNEIGSGEFVDCA